MDDEFAGMAGEVSNFSQIAEHGDAATSRTILACLIRTNFHVLEEANARLQDVPPELPPDLGGEFTSLFWMIVTTSLRQQNDNLLATFLEQLITLGTGQPVAFLTTMRQYSNRLLQKSSSLANTSPGSGWLVDELLATLLRLLIPEEPQPQLEVARNSRDVDSICISVGDEKFDVTPQQVLEYFWRTKLNTDCLVCKEPFEDRRGPPIRTFSRTVERDGEAGSAKKDIRCCIRVFNRHFECLKGEGVQFIPVSHVWHRPVSEAHHHPKRTNKEAGTAVFDTIVQLLSSSRIAYEDDTEFWHDYLSVPQWVYEVQQSLLFILPSIYHAATEILVCMRDVHGRHISQVLRLKHMLSQRLSLVNCLDAIPALYAFFHCQWLQRMWVSVEYACSQKASLMDGDHRIWRTWPLNDTAPTDFLSQFSDDAQRLLNEVFTQASAFSRSIFIGMPYFSRQAENPCLGEIVSMIGGKNCLYSRDRFIAVHAILNQSAPTTHLHRQPSLPKDATALCHQVWLHALEIGDYSPLLLRPPPEEEQTVQARWLVGYETLCRQSWGLGNMISGPTERGIVSEGCLKPKMEVVGNITNICLVDFLDRDGAGIMEKILSLFQTTCTGGIINFVSAITRLFPIDIDHKRLATRIHRLPPLSYNEHT
ncbi:Ff.00g133490.m01.CDS01 [Fusarium sp. VM40]|nr:Ff.00g133490.m01.CDS01 [Fusarium sp. VM40]